MIFQQNDYFVLYYPGDSDNLLHQLALKSILLNTLCQNMSTLVLLIASYFECFDFIYFCYSILTTLWHKVHSNFDPAYFYFSHRWFWISFSQYFQSSFFSSNFIRSWPVRITWFLLNSVLFQTLSLINLYVLL